MTITATLQASGMNEAILQAISNRRPFSIITVNGHSTYNA
jgi:hypothetical protein